MFPLCWLTVKHSAVRAGWQNCQGSPDVFFSITNARVCDILFANSLCDVYNFFLYHVRSFENAWNSHFLVSLMRDTSEISYKIIYNFEPSKLFSAKQSASMHVNNGYVSKYSLRLGRSTFHLQRKISRHQDNLAQIFLGFLFICVEKCQTMYTSA